uniref:Uncharacterized protein n=1 Tax=Arion vulgaris TaxID=1028688 RepID=A0A0B7AD06_9EUPU
MLTGTTCAAAVIDISSNNEEHFCNEGVTEQTLRYETLITSSTEQTLSAHRS